MDLRRVIETSRSIAHEVAGPNAEAVDQEGRWPLQAMRSLQETGLAGLVVPARFGGLGLGLLGLAHASEELGQQCASTSMCFGMHCVGSAVLAAKATPEHASGYLEPVSRGEHLTTLALSEPGTGVHFYFPQCQCQPDGDGSLRIAGEKAFVTNGGQADSYVVSVQRSDQPRQPGGKFSCVVVDATAEGLGWGDPWNGLGLRGNSSRNLLLTDVRVPRDRLLGAEGDQLWYVFHVVAPYFLTAMAGTYLGIARAALDACTEAVKRRTFSHSGKRAGHSPIVQHRLGTLWADVARNRAFLRDSAARADRGEGDALPAILSVKAEIADSCNHVVGEAMTLMGGVGFREDSKLHRLLRDARAAHVMSPTTDLLRQWVGRALLNLPLLGD